MRGVRQILLNLLGNAIKFTETGGVKWIVRFVHEDRPRLEVDVVDSGIGIADKNRSKVFSAFSKEDSSRNRQLSGAGLGLTLCRRLARSLGGDVTHVESKLEVGTCFRLTIEAKVCEDSKTEDIQSDRIVPTTPARFNTKAKPRLEAPRILLVEDCPDTQRLFCHVLRKAGAEVEVVESGAMAIEEPARAMDNNNPFTVILMDMRMPVMDGYEATARLRENGYQLPIIALAAHAMTDDRERCLAAGCDEYTSQPIVWSSLFELITRFAPVATC